MKADLDSIKNLREQTGAAILDIKNALEDAAGDIEKAKKALIEKGMAKAEKKSERSTKDGLVYSYIHTGGKIGSLVLMACETDFVARTDDFKKLCHEIAMQICTDDYEDVTALLNSEYMRDPSKKISDVITEYVARLGEKIELIKFVKFSVFN